MQDCGVFLQHEPEAGKSANAKTSCVVLLHKGLQQLQTSCSHFTPDEDTGAAGPCPCLTSGGSFYGPTPVCLPAWQRTGRRHPLPPGQITVSTQKVWKNCRDHVIWFLWYFHHNTAFTSGRQAGSQGDGPTPHVLDPGLPHQLATVCEDSGLCDDAGATQGTVLAPFLFTLYTADFYHRSFQRIYKSSGLSTSWEEEELEEKEE